MFKNKLNDSLALLVSKVENLYEVYGPNGIVIHDDVEYEHLRKCRDAMGMVVQLYIDNNFSDTDKSRKDLAFCKEAYKAFTYALKEYEYEKDSEDDSTMECIFSGHVEFVEPKSSTRKLGGALSASRISTLEPKRKGLFKSLFKRS